MQAESRAPKKGGFEGSDVVSLRLLPIVLLRHTLEFLSDASSVMNLALSSRQQCKQVQTALHMDNMNDQLGYIFKEVMDRGGVPLCYLSGFVGYGTEGFPYRVDWDILGRHLTPFLDLSLSMSLLLRHIDITLDKSSTWSTLDTPHHSRFKFGLRKSSGFLKEFRGDFYLNADGTRNPPRLYSMQVKAEAPTEWSVGYFIYGDNRRRVFARQRDRMLTIRVASIETLHGNIHSFILDRENSCLDALSQKQGIKDFAPSCGTQLRIKKPRMRLVLYGLDVIGST